MKTLMTADTVGGVWTYAIDLARGLAARGCAVTLLTMGAAASPSQRRQAAAVPGLTLVDTDYKLEWMPEPWDDVQRAADLLWDLAAAVRPDVLHLNGFAHAALPWRRAGIPTLVVGHSCVETWWRAVKGTPTGPEWDRYRHAVRRGIHHADAFVAPTHAILDAFARCHGRPRHAAAIHNGRDASLYRPRAKEPFVLTAGRLWDEAKNTAALERAAPRVRLPICVAGETHAAQTTPSRLKPLGQLSPRRLADCMGRASIYAAPARYEPFGLSVLEAALSGCALVLGDLPTFHEVWGDAALYVPPDDHHALADAINRLARVGDERRALAHAAHTRAQRYTLDAMADAYLAAYRRLAARASPATPRATRAVPGPIAA